VNANCVAIPFEVIRRATNILKIIPMHRRAFLKLSAGVVTAAGASPFSSSGAAPKRDLRKAIMYSTIGVKGAVLDKFKAMKAAGFAGVEPLGAMNRDEVIAALNETGLQAASVCDHIHWVKPLSAPDEATRKLGYDGLIQSLQDAHVYGATSVLLVPGVVAGNGRDGSTYQECWDRSIIEIKKAIPLARELGVTISIENVGNNFIKTPEEAVHYLDAINSEQVGWHFDIGNVGRRGPAAEKWIEVLGKRIVRLHIKDFSAEPAKPGQKSGATRPKLMEGGTNWPAVMAALDKVGYRGWGISEQPSDQAADVESARDLAERMDRIFAL
jgi:hexulose-6-phosphate isomerase